MTLMNAPAGSLWEFCFKYGEPAVICVLGEPDPKMRTRDVLIIDDDCVVWGIGKDSALDRNSMRIA